MDVKQQHITSHLSLQFLSTSTYRTIKYCFVLSDSYFRHFYMVIYLCHTKSIKIYLTKSTSLFWKLNDFEFVKSTCDWIPLRGVFRSSGLGWVVCCLRPVPSPISIYLFTYISINVCFVIFLFPFIFFFLTGLRYFAT